MKYRVQYNRVEARTFTLSTTEIHEAIRKYVESRWSTLAPPAHARQEIEIDLDGDSHAEAGTLTQRFIYDPEPQASGVDDGPLEMPMPDMPANTKNEPANLARASGDASAMAPEETMECSICHERVAAEQTDEHLATAHPTPPEGFQFFYDGQAYRTDRPSMQVSELLTLVNGGRTYQFYEDRDGALIPLSHAQAVDLTNGPRRFFSIPPATGN